MVSAIYDGKWPLNIEVDNIENPGLHDDCRESSKLITIRVNGNYTIGYLISLVVQKIAIAQDWSDYAFWWPSKKKWLKQFRMNLNQAEVHSDSKLNFTAMHKNLRIQLPDLKIIEMSVDFSVNLLTVTEQLCSHLSIRHPEEMSFARPLTSHNLKRNNTIIETSPLQRSVTPTSEKKFNFSSKTNSYSNGTISNRSNGTMSNKSNGSLLNVSVGTISSNGSLNGSNYSLSSPDSNRATLLRPKSLAEKARLNSAWLNSSISLYEQEVFESDLLLLKFKFYSFFDLNPKLDVARVNYIYEQLKWAIIFEEINCTEDEMYTLAGINLQVTFQSGGNPDMTKPNRINGTVFYTQKSNDSSLSGFNTNNGINGNGINGHSLNGNGINGNGINEHGFNANGVNGHSINENGINGRGCNGTVINGNGFNGNSFQYNRQQSKSSINETNGQMGPEIINNDIDSALEDLEKTLEKSEIGSSKQVSGNGQPNLLAIPKLRDELKIRRQNGTGTLGKLFNSDKSYYVIFCDTSLSAFKTSDYDTKNEIVKGEPTFMLNLNKCEIIPHVLVSVRKYCFQVIESKPNTINEYWFRCRDEKQYAQWFAACKQASLGRTMANASYEEEVKSTLKLLQIQSSTQVKSRKNKVQLECLSIQPEDYVSQRILKRRSREQIIHKIKTAQENFASNTTIEAQMNFIKTCQSLREFATALFVIRFSKSKKEEFIGVTPTKLTLIDSSTGSFQKSWRYNTLMAWNVNWDVKKVQLNFSEENIEFECLSADCKVIHEFIGGYIFMSMRTSANHQLSQEQFLKLTGGWDEHDEHDEQN